MALAAALMVCQPTAGFAQDDAPPAELVALCKKILCRTPSVRLNLENGQEFTHVQPIAFPILQNGWISVYPGEEIYIEA